MKTYGSPRAATAAKPAERAAPASASATHQAGPPSEQALRELLAEHHGNIAAVGRALGKERVQIHRWLRRYEIDVGEYRTPDDEQQG